MFIILREIISKAVFRSPSLLVLLVSHLAKVRVR
jgi:hypothetical protein